MDCLVDPKVSVILSELENGEKDMQYLKEKLQLTREQIITRLAFVIENQFVIVSQRNQIEYLGVDFEKLNQIMEGDGNFKNVVNGLTELDQFLN